MGMTDDTKYVRYRDPGRPSDAGLPSGLELPRSAQTHLAA